MKLMSFTSAQGSSYGAVEGKRVRDLGARLGAEVPDLRAAIALGQLSRLEKLVAASEADFSLDEISFLPVIPNPGKIICAGLNYEAHRTEGGRPDTSDPALFLRFAESQTGHEQPLLCPHESADFDFEGEIAVVIGTGGRRIPPDQALSHVAGTACYNDGSVRDWQLRTTQWTPGKNFPQTGAFGPWMVTADELPADRVLSLVTRVNGQEMQRTTTDLMTFPVARLISFISTFTTLEPGDVIVTGTPGGVGFRRNPQVFLKDGDTVEVEVSDVGILRNTVRKEVL